LVTLWKWLPVLLGGFVFNLAISAMAMSTGTLAGLVLGYAQISQLKAVRKLAAVITHFFRNAPWLVLLFYCMFLLPFQVHVFGVTVPIPDWVKATFGLALPVMANVAEIVRGAVQSIPTAQWESAASLAFNRRQTMWMIILPQCVKRMLPPWMNLYAILTMSTVLTSIVGVAEIMTLTGRVLSAENRPGLLLSFYGFVLVLFFLYCYPIARWTVRLEAKYAVDH
jgi:polar amino acid transport system permease protein